MNVLCMDTSHRFLALGVIQDGKVTASVQKECWKKQSEELFPCLESLMEECGLKPEDIDAVAVSRGPGSYTGVRIALTVAKVLCAACNIPLYTVGTLRLYAGRKPDCLVVTDARGGRVYTAVYDCGNEVKAPVIERIEDVIPADHAFCGGDGKLVGKEDMWPDIIGNFAQLREYWQEEENVHMAVPEYMKANEAYLVKK